MDIQSGVQSLDRAFGLLEALSLQPAGMALMELAGATGLHKSTVHRLLASLTGLGYVKKAGDGTRYQLTLKVVELSGRVLDSIDVLGVAKRALDGLRDRAQETVHLVVREGGDIVYTYKAESLGSSYRMFSRIGMRRAMYCTAAGKSILATLPDGEIARLWQVTDVRPYTRHTILTLDRLMEELRTIRSLGYALDNEENELGVRCIAAAVTDYTGSSTSAFSLSAPIVRMSDTRVEELASLMLAARDEINQELGHTAGR